MEKLHRTFLNMAERQVEIDTANFQITLLVGSLFVAVCLSIGLYAYVLTTTIQ